MARQRKQDRTNVNRDIRAPEVRVVGADGEQIGVMPIEEALRKAGDLHMDLVEVSPNAKPPVCKIMDYGRYKYEETKKHQEARKKQKGFQVKEIKVRPATDIHDLQTKVKHIRKFISNRDKVKVTLVFRGREITLSQQAREVLERVAEMTEEFAQVEQYPKFEGRTMTMVLSPK
ncbi:MAG: translation initiation factor IF-3 [Desulfobacteraceae bacterium]|nr:translation initiation factor IF-3 [Desulfobacteraceae bacterium]